MVEKEERENMEEYGLTNPLLVGVSRRRRLRLYNYFLIARFTRAKREAAFCGVLALFLNASCLLHVETKTCGCNQIIMGSLRRRMQSN